MVQVDHKQAALDFLSFVNDSPTRQLLAPHVHVTSHSDLLQLSTP
jgi:hypothetical protein